MGLFSTIHCLGMCGGIVGALSYSLTPSVREKTGQRLLYTLAFNVGRIGSYGLAGALMGVIGRQLYQTVSPGWGYLVLQSLAALLMVGVGLYLAGWLPRFATIERLGVPLWRRLEPLGRRLLPVRTPFQALLYGLIWGWLPCGLVYSALALTITGTASPLQGALFMVAFGIGTLPAIAGTGMLTSQMLTLTRRPLVRRAAGLLLIILALAGLLFAEQLHQLIPSWPQQDTTCEI